MSKLPDTSKMSDDEFAKMISDLVAEKAAMAEEQENKIKFLNVNKKGIPRNVVSNAQQIYDYYGISCRYNEMRRAVEIDMPNVKYSPDTKNTAVLAYMESLYNGQDFPSFSVRNHLIFIANQNAYHPVRDWLDTIVWDGTSRLNDFYKTVTLNTETHGTAEYVDLAHTLMRKWAISAMAAIYSEDVYIEGVLCFQGKQGIGKSRWPHYLVPDIGKKWIRDGIVLDVKSTDSKLNATSVWIGELSELDATFRKADISALKAFLTSKSDNIRLPYDIAANDYVRRSVYVASVNEAKFLHDEQNRRFWILSADSFNQPTFDIGQFWAEMKQIYLSGAEWILDDNEIALLHKLQTELQRRNKNV